MRQIGPVAVANNTHSPKTTKLTAGMSFCKLGHICTASLLLPTLAAGDEITAGDSALFPTFVFATYILPRYFGWRDVFAGRPNLAGWWANIQQDQHAQRVSAAASMAHDMHAGGFGCHSCCSCEKLLQRCLAVCGLTRVLWMVMRGDVMAHSPLPSVSNCSCGVALVAAPCTGDC